MISIITPTYNRSKLLPKAYKSLITQTSNEFEWLIIDDGSSDNTKDVIEKFILQKKINIRYYYKENGGKHTAVNTGVQNANGELTLILDSDDQLRNDAIETIINDWKKYSDNKKICGLSYNRNLIGYSKKIKIMDKQEIISNHIEFRYNKDYLADRLEVYRTSVMQNYPFPEILGERFLSEAVVWNKIAYEYDTVYINKDIYFCEYLNDGLTSNSIKTRVNNPKGSILNYEIMMKKPFKLSLRIKYSILYNTFSKFANVSFKNRLKNGNGVLIILTKPLGDIVYLKWKKYLKK